nr:PE family protein [Mycobacterium simiae]
MLAAGADEVSAAIAALFGTHGQAYQAYRALSAQAVAFHQQFVQLLATSRRGRRLRAGRGRQRRSGRDCVRFPVGILRLDVLGASFPAA